MLQDSLKSPYESDTQLQQSIEEWVSKYNDENSDKLNKAILEAVIYIAHNLLMEKAILLPWACKVFLQAYDTELIGSIKSIRGCILWESTMKLSWYHSANCNLVLC